MRIIAGRFRGHALAAAPREGVRPTADPVREALFNILGPRVTGRPFVDLCAGTGAVGLEALSRGAEPVFLVEQDRRALETIRRNLVRLHVAAETGPLTVVAADAGRWLRREAHRVLPEPVAVFFLDPPYDDARLTGWIGEISRSGKLGPDSLVVVEHRAGSAPEFPGLEVAWSRRYGDTGLTAACLGQD